FSNSPALIFYYLIAFDYVSALKPYHLTWCQSEKFFRRVFQKVLPFDIQFFAKWHIAIGWLLFLGIVFTGKHFSFTRPHRIIRKNNFQRIKYYHTSLCHLIQMLTNAEFKQAEIRKVFSFGDPYPFTKITNTFRRVTPASHPADRRHTRIIPPFHVLVIYQLQQFSFTHYCIGQIATGKFILMRRIYLELFNKPVI